MTDGSPKPALQFADIATLSRKRITSPDKVRSGLDKWATSVTASFKAALEEWPREVPDPVDELGCLWRLAQEDSDCRRMLRAKLGFACVLSSPSVREQPAMLPWHVGLACAMSYFPKEFPSLPMWARRAVLHELTESTRNSVASFLSHKCLVPRLEENCRREMRPTKAESQEWQALKRFEIKELQRFSKEERRLKDEESAIQEKEMDLEARKVKLSQEREEAAKELEEIQSDSLLHLNDTRSKQVRRDAQTLLYIHILHVAIIIEGPLDDRDICLLGFQDRLRILIIHFYCILYLLERKGKFSEKVFVAYISAAFRRSTPRKS